MKEESKEFDLKFLGLGQHISISSDQHPSDLESAFELIKKNFCKPKDNESDPLPDNLQFDQNAQWLIGLQFQLLSFINISAVFNDPHLYGLLIKLEGNQAGEFNEFKFAIEYEKVSDSLGAYKGKIALPENLRRLEFGTITVSLPEFYIELYSNGDYKVDVGFPTNLDFSRSLIVEVLPYKGAGGFYIARLSPGASKLEPETSKGSFSPITEFGIGMELGVGKSIDKGILKAGLSLTFLGILEGCLAFYKPYGENEGKGKRYHWLQGTFGISGMLYGEVDLSIVAARVEALVQVIAQVTFESYKATPVVVKVQVSARADIKVDFGIRKYTITKTFDKEIDADFQIGTNSEAPWDDKSIPTAEPVVKSMKWQPLILEKDEKRNLNLYFLPHLTIADEEVEDNPVVKRQANYSAMTYIDSSSEEDNSFKKLIEAILIWTINAYVNSDKQNTTLEDALNSDVSDEDLCNIYNYLTGNRLTQTSIVYRNPDNNEDIVSFLSKYFQINICHPDTSGTSENSMEEFPVSFFPIFPDLELIIEHSKVENPGRTEIVHKANFTSYNKCDKKYLSDIKEYIQHLLVSYQTVVAQQHDQEFYQKGIFIEDSISIATWFFQDCISMIAKAVISEARECIKDRTKVYKLVNKTLSSNTVGYIAAMISRYMLHGMRIPGPEDRKYSLNTKTYPIYKLIGQQFTIPTVKPSDKLFLTLENKGELEVEFKQCPATTTTSRDQSIKIEIPEWEMERIRRISNVTLQELGKVNSLKTFDEVCPTYSLKNPITLKNSINLNEDKKLCFFTESLTKVLDKNVLLKLQKSKLGEKPTDINDYILATCIDVDIYDITKLTNFNAYDVIGADEKGKELLGKIFKYIKPLTHLSDAIDSIHLLYVEKDQQGLKYDENAKVDLTKTNLSTETNPDVAINSSKNEQFIEYLYQSSLVRSGGFYLNYCNENNEGIPRENFDEGLKGKISILVKYRNETPISSFMNCIVLDGSLVNENESFFFEEQNNKIKIPVFSQGHIGIEVQRNEEIHENLDMKYIIEQFNLIGFKICNNDWFTEQPSSPLPIGATNESLPTKDLYYKTVFPIAKFAKNQSPVLSDTDWDPYAGIGGYAKIQLHLQDLFGNQLNQPYYVIDSPIRYRDFLIPIHQWPSIKLDYEFINEEATKIHIDLIFDVKNYRCGLDPSQCEKAKKYAAIDKETYRKIYYQLIQSDVEVYYISSITKSLINPDGSKMMVDKNTLVEYVKKIYYFLEKAENGQTGNVPPYQIEQEIIMTNEEPIFELTLCFTIERTNLDHIDSDFKDVDAVKQAITKVWPKVVYNQTHHPLYHFTEDFERIFSSKIALGTSVENEINQGENKKVWVVHFDPAKNLNYEIKDDAYFYAPIPISRNRKTFKDVVITPFKDPGPDPNPVITKDFPDVDLDQWAKECLNYIDQLLAPQYAVAAHQVNEGQVLDEILNAKKLIAESITKSIMHIGNLKSDYVEYNLEEAKEKFKQQILIKLSNAYDIDTIVQHPVCVRSPYENVDSALEAPRTYGTLSGNLLNSYRLNGEQLIEDQNNQEYSFSTAKISLKNGMSWLTYLFNTKQDGKYQRYLFQDMTYQVSHIEHEIRDIAGMEGYKASSWLSFIIPWNDKREQDMNELEIPIPLRSYPIPPSIEAHQSVYNPTQTNPLSQTRNWDYKYTYKQTLEAQDQIKAKIELNVKKEDAGFISQLEIDELGKALAQFRYIWPEIKAYLDTNLSRKDVCPEPDEPERNTEIERAFIKLKDDLNRLALAWSNWALSINQVKVTQVNNKIELNYDIIESADKKDSNLCITVKSKEDISLPWITIDGYDTEEVASGVYKFYQCLDEEESIKCRNKVYLTYEQRKNIPTRNILLRGLDILNNRHAWGGAYLTRNENLFDNCNTCIYDSTNESFLYQTEFAKMANQITPFLVNEQFIDIAALFGESQVRSLEDHLTNMVMELLRDPTVLGLSYSKEHVIKGWIGYQFNLSKDRLYLPKIKVPSFLTLPFQYEDGDDIIKNLSEKMLNIFTTRPDGPETSIGTFVIELAIYDKKENELPILKLKNMYLDVNKILELSNL
ncbi:hypothetical protein [Bacillus thuringiensis]|uniref:hypothetical protein n=1 Tax=Bacillus thuringiensis TaxID=1428 RepID=UPI00103EF3D8|nr:hypothetical protein [Bacillus thuringiensis]TBX38569.1 hypothetical protein E0M35_29255 [Bacillus thuringiensis]